MRQAHGPLPTAERLRKRGDYLRLRASGARLRSGPIRVQFTPNGTKTTRLGITVPKFEGLAPLRNRIKRILRESWRTVRADFPPGLDIVLIVDAAEPCTELAAVVALLERAAQKLNSKRP